MGAARFLLPAVKASRSPPPRSPHPAAFLLRQKMKKRGGKKTPPQRRAKKRPGGRGDSRARSARRGSEGLLCRCRFLGHRRTAASGARTSAQRTRPRHGSGFCQGRRIGSGTFEKPARPSRRRPSYPLLPHPRRRQRRPHRACGDGAKRPSEYHSLFPCTIWTHLYSALTLPLKRRRVISNLQNIFGPQV